MVDKTFQNLARLIEAKGLSQAELSRATGVQQPTIWRILNPNAIKGVKSPSDKQVRALALYFRISTDQLRGYEDFDMEGVVALATPPSQDFASKDINDPIGWLQLIAEIKDPEVLQSLRGIATILSRPEMASGDARMLETIAQKFFQAAKSPARKLP